eukprot:TRINITY_DN682_c0_g1_i1.p1 TRINITY_DN682_c0_g1~~TRINITY_DN682_c0_g1_i1.p1  ORF type:complete len:678 (+),score=222.94 TRINITY_DN682_c0_g1_i1:89-2122(+)
MSGADASMKRASSVVGGTERSFTPHHAPRPITPPPRSPASSEAVHRDPEERERDIAICSNRSITDPAGLGVLLCSLIIWILVITVVGIQPRAAPDEIARPVTFDNDTRVRCGAGSEAAYPYYYHAKGVCMASCPLANTTVCDGCNGASVCEASEFCERTPENQSTTSMLWMCWQKQNAEMTWDNFASETWLGRYYVVAMAAGAMLIAFLFLAVLHCHQGACVVTVLVSTAALALYVAIWSWKRHSDMAFQEDAPDRPASDEGSYFFFFLFFAFFMAFIAVCVYACRVDKLALVACCDLSGIALTAAGVPTVLLVVAACVARATLIGVFLYVELLIVSLEPSASGWEDFRLLYHAVNFLFFCVLLNFILAWMGFALCYQLTSWYFSQPMLSSAPKFIQTSRHGYGVLAGANHIGTFALQAVVKTFAGFGLCIRNLLQINKKIVICGDLSVFAVTAVHGGGLLESARVASSIMRTQLPQRTPANLKFVTDCVWYICKAVIATGATCGGWMMMDSALQGDTDRYYFGIGPWLVMWCTGYAMGNTVFAGMQAMAHGLLLLSALDMDLTVTAQPHAPPALLAFFARNAPPPREEQMEESEPPSRPASAESKILPMASSHRADPTPRLLSRESSARSRGREVWGDGEGGGSPIPPPRTLSASAMKYEVASADDLHDRDTVNAW